MVLVLAPKSLTIYNIDIVCVSSSLQTRTFDIRPKNWGYSAGLSNKKGGLVPGLKKAILWSRPLMCRVTPTNLYKASLSTQPWCKIIVEAGITCLKRIEWRLTLTSKVPFPNLKKASEMLVAPRISEYFLKFWNLKLEISVGTDYKSTALRCL